MSILTLLITLLGSLFKSQRQLVLENLAHQSASDAEGALVTFKATSILTRRDKALQVRSGYYAKRCY